VLECVLAKFFDNLVHQLVIPLFNAVVEPEGLASAFFFAQKKQVAAGEWKIELILENK
jgi:hypothetical protein